MNTDPRANAKTVIDLDGLDEPAKAVGAPLLVEDADEPGAVVDEDLDAAGPLPPRAVQNLDGTITLPLRYPVTLQVSSRERGVRADTTAELVFHRLNGGDLRLLAGAPAANAASLAIARSTRKKQLVMNAIFDRMDAADINDAVAVIGFLSGTGPTTGR